MSTRKRILSLLAASLPLILGFPSPLSAGEGEVITLPVREDAQQRILLLQPSGPPVASVALYSGGNGNVGIRPDGSIRNGDNFLVRSRNLFANHGFLVAVVDRPSDWAGADSETFRLTPAHADDAAAIAKVLREKADVPLWFIGTSRGTVSVASIASRLGRQLISGIVLTSSVTAISRNSAQMVQDADLSGIGVPVLILGHGYDDCRVTPWPEQEALARRFLNAPAVEAFRIEGGDVGDMSAPCSPYSHHGFFGQEEMVVARIAEWIKAHLPRR